jgi:SAM-dependent methyltransferase
MADLDAVYAQRFDDAESREKDALWGVLGPFLQRWVDASAPVLDLACDRGYFVRHIRASERWASDLRDVRTYLPADVRFVQGDGLQLREALPTDHFGTVFTSNYLEHLGSSDEVVDQIRVVHDLLRPGGRFVVLQPNIRLVGGAYWDFIDHRVPLTEKSLQEAAAIAGLVTDRVITRFLPFTIKSRFPNIPFLVWAYLAFRPAWFVLGKQTLFVARRP